MPWTTKDVDEHKKGLTDNQKELWVSVANDALARCLDKGKEEGACEASAIRQANAVVNRAAEAAEAEEMDAEMDAWFAEWEEWAIPTH